MSMSRSDGSSTSTTCRSIGTCYSVGETIAKGLLPFVLGDVLKLVLVAGVLPAAWWVVGRQR